MRCVYNSVARVVKFMLLNIVHQFYVLCVQFNGQDFQVFLYVYKYSVSILCCVSTTQWTGLWSLFYMFVNIVCLFYVVHVQFSEQGCQVYFTCWQLLDINFIWCVYTSVDRVIKFILHDYNMLQKSTCTI